MGRGQIIALATEVIPPENTPEKRRTDTLTAHPRWKYIGPGDTIRFEWQIGKWGWAGFAGESARQYMTRVQPASTELKEFTTSLPAISLSPLTPMDEPYDCEIWFKDKFSDLRVIVENCVKITGPLVPPPSDIADWDFVPSGGIYDLGAVVPFTASYKYKGKAQSGWLTISLGTGVYPSFFTKHTFARTAVSFVESMDWAPGYLSGNFALPTTLEQGQTYSVRAKLETADGVQETDTDWGVITIKEAPPPPKPEITDLTIVTPTKSTWIGGIIYITVMFKYVGPAITGELYAAIGVKDTWFNEKWDSGWVTVPISEATFKQTRLASATIPIVGGSPGKYDIYAKISAPGIADVFSPVYLDTITITA